jgi:hypothetical protein
VIDPTPLFAEGEKKNKKRKSEREENTQKKILVSWR